ncbi:MAG: hypothetical protein JWP97_2290 [Labilithrix sp.]|nr:hypothetical protein [Labilithrix sp.]
METPESSETVRAEPASPAPVPVRGRRSLLKFLLLALGLLVALYFAGTQPKDQHLRLVLGDRSGDVTAIALQYLGTDGEAARAAELRFDPGTAPRIVSHEPKLSDGDYTLRIDLDTREGRRSTERRVTLGGGTTQVDLTSLLGPSGSSTEKPRTSP